MPLSVTKWFQGIYERREELFQTAIHLSEKGLEEGRRACTFLGKTRSYEKLHTLWGKVFSSKEQTLPLQSDFEKFTQELQVEAASPQEERSLEKQKEWRELSYLREAPVRADILTLSSFTALFKNCSSLLRGEVSYFLEVFPRVFKSSSKVAAFASPFQRAVIREREFQELIGGNLGKGEKEQREKLAARAEDLARELSSQTKNAPFFFLGGTSQENGLAKKMFEYLRDFSPINLDFLQKKGGEEETVKHGKEAFRTTLGLSDNTERELLAARQGIIAAVSSCSEFLEKRFPDLYGKLLESLKLDFREMMTGSIEEGKKAKRYEAFLLNWKENGAEKMIESWVRKVLSGSKETIHRAIHELISMIPIAMLPPLLDAAHMGSGNQSILLSFTKGDDGTFTLYVYGSGGASEFHPKIKEEGSMGSVEKTAIPLVFRGIREDQLNKEFFLKLLSFRAYPEWGEGIAHTPQEFYEFLKRELPCDLSSSPFLSFVPQTNGEWENFQLFFSHQEKMDPLQFREALYLVRRQALIDLWSTCNQDPLQLRLDPNLVYSLEMGCQIFSEEALFLRKQGRISEQEMQRVYATVFEIKTALAKREHRPHDLNQTPSFVFSEQSRNAFQALLEELKISSSDVYLMKDLLLSLVGDEMEGSIDALLTECIPHLADHVEKAKAENAPSWKELFSLATFKEYGKEMRLLRPSLLHLYRVYGWVTSALFKAIYRGITTQVLIVLLRRVFSPFVHLSYMPMSLIANLLIEYGLPVVIPFLPKELVDVLSTLYAFYQELIFYIKRRVASLIIKETALFFCGKEELAKLQLAIKEVVGILTKEGEISFNVNSAPPQPGTLVIPPAAKQRVSPFSGSKESDHFPPISFKSVRTPFVQSGIEARLLEIINESDRLYKTEGLKSQERVYFYLKRELFAFPIPDPKHKGIWDEVEHPELCIERIHTLALRFEASARALGHVTDVGKKVALLYAMEAIVDRLARRCDARIELAPNGCELALFMSNPSLRLSDPRWVQKLETVVSYFGFDPGKTYEVGEINRRRGNCLFNFESLGTWRPSLFKGGRFVIQLSYYGLFLSKEGRYYLELLKDPTIQQKMKVWGATSRWQQMALLFRDPSLAEWTQQVPPYRLGNIKEEVRVLSLGTSDADMRKGILPRPFYCLRSLHFLSTRSVVSSVTEKESFRHDKNAGLMLTPQHIAFSFPFQVLNEIAEFTTCFLHAISFDFFRKLTLGSNLLIGKTLSTQALFMQNKELLLKVRAQAAYQMKNIPSFWSFWLFAMGRKKTEEEILRSPPLHKELPSHLSKALEMVPLYPRDQVVRALAFFGEKRELLKEPQYRLLFDFFFHRFRALSLQLKESVAIKEALHHFFADTIEGFDAEEELEPLLFLVKIAEETRKWVPTLPNFRSKLRELLARKSHYEHFGRILSVLLSTYREIEPEDLTEEERRLAVIDFSRFLFSRRPIHEVDQDGIEDELFRWGPYVVQKVKEEPILRGNMIRQLFLDAGEKSPPKGLWKGEFPVYRTKENRIHLYSLQGTKREHLELHVQNILTEFNLEAELSQGYHLSDSCMCFPEAELRVELVALDGQCEVYKKIGKKKLRLIQNPKRVLEPFQGKYQLGEEETLWIVEGLENSLLCLKDGKILWEVPLLKKGKRGSFEVVVNESLVEERVMREVSLSEVGHRLSLLTSFEKEDRIKGYVLPKAPTSLIRLEFTSLGLSFHMEEREGELLAFSQKIAPGFFIAKKQRDPHLFYYGRILLLENFQGEKRVLLRREPFSVLYSSAFLHRMSLNILGIGLSPILLHLLEKESRHLANKEEGNNYDLFTLRFDHRLETNSPESLSYLLLYHVVYGNEKEWLFYSEQLLSLGRRTSFSEETHSLVDQLSFCFLFSRSRKGDRLQLTLGALQEENRLLFPSPKRQSPQKKEGQVAQLSWALSLCLNYQRYLEDLEKGGEAFLTEEQELFLLHGIAETTSLSFASLKENIEEGLSLKGDAFIFRYFSSLPKIRKRFLQLQIRLVGMEKWKMRKETFSLFFAKELYRFWLPSASPFSQIDQGCGQVATRLSTHVRISSEQLRARLLPIWRQFSAPLERFGRNEICKGAQKAQVFNHLQGVTEALASDHLTPFTSMSRISSLVSFLFSLKKQWESPAGKNLDDLASFFKGVDLEKPLSAVPISFEEVSSRDFFRYFPQYYALASGNALPKDKPLQWEGNEEEFLTKSKIFRRTLELYDGRYEGDLGKLLLILKMVAFSNQLSPCHSQTMWIAIETAQKKKDDKPLEETIKKLLTHQSHVQILLPLSNWLKKRRVEKGMERECVRIKEGVKDRVLALAQQTGGERFFENARATYQKFHSFYQVGTYLFPIIHVMQDMREFEREESSRVGRVKRTSVFSLSERHISSLSRREELLTRMMRRLYDEFFSKSSQGRLLLKKTEEELREKLEEMEKESSRCLQAQEKRIESLVNHLDFRQGGSLGELFLLIKRESFSFNDILCQFIRGNFERLIKHASLKTEEGEKIKEEILLYLSVKGRLSHLFHVAKRGTPSEIGEALQRERSYTFSDAPDQVLSHLLFESGTSYLVKKEQVLALDRVRKTEGSSLLELPTGGGKTFWLTPTLQYLQGRKSLLFAIWPLPLFPTSTQRVGKQSEELFYRGYRIFHFQRSMEMSKETLWAFYLMFAKAKEEGEQINSTREDHQGFELSFIERVLGGGDKEELTLWKKSLQFLRLHAVPICDEFHDQVEPRRNLLNYPLGGAQFLDPRLVEIATEICRFLIIDDFSSWITIKSKKPYPLSPHLYRAHILPSLARQVALLWKVDTAREKELLDFLQGGKKTPYLSRHPLASEIFFAQGFLMQELPKALEKRPQIDYGMKPSSKGGSGYAQPSRGNNALQTKSWFQNPYEALVKTILLRLHIRLTEEESHFFIDHLRKAALEERKRRGCSLETTEAAQFFQKITTFPLFGYPKSKENIIFESLCQSDEVIFRVVREIDAVGIRYFTQSLNSDAQNFFSMYPRFVGCTASTANRGCAPVGTTPLLVQGATERSEALIKEKCTEIIVVARDDPEAFLAFLLERFFKSIHMRALIDPAALLNGMENERVARQMGEYFEKWRHDIHGIIYYDEENQQLFWSIQEKRAVPYEKTKHSLLHTFTFFDDTHTFGADIDLAEGAEAVLTYNAALSFERLRQAAGRMRGLASKRQSFKIVCTNKTEEELLGPKLSGSEERDVGSMALTRGVKPEGMLSIDHILAQAKRVEEENLKPELLFSDLQKVKNTLRRLVLDVAFTSPDIDSSLRIIKEFRDLLVTEQNLKPTDFYGKEEIEISSKELLAAEKRRMIKRIEKSSLSTEKEKLCEKLEEISGESDGMMIKAYRQGEKDAYEMPLFDAEVEMIQTFDQERQQNISQEQDASLLHQLKQQLCNTFTFPWQNKTIIPYWPWSEKLDPYDLDSWMRRDRVPKAFSGEGASSYLLGACMQMGKNKFLGYPPVPLYPLSELLFSSTPLLAELRGVSKAILGSNNFFPMLHPEYGQVASFIPFAEFQLPFSEVLLVLSSQGELSVLILTQKEADYWRGKIQERRGEGSSRIVLYDIALSSIVSSHPDCPFPEEVVKGEPFKEILVQLKFFKGDAQYKRELYPALEGWIKRNGVRLTRSAFFVLTKDPQGFIGSDLALLFKKLEVSVSTPSF